MTKEELHEKYGLDKDMTLEELKERHRNGDVLNPIYKKHLEFTWLMQNIWGHVECGNISQGKARELTAGATEEYINSL